MILAGQGPNCPGCGCRLPAIDGPVHPYMIASPACWAAFGAVLAAEYADARLMPVHRLSVDAYAVQHPGDGSRQAIQSVGLHLVRLMMQLDAAMSPEAANGVMLRLSSRKASLPRLPPPGQFDITVADVVPHAGTTDHADRVRAWARNALESWAHQHAVIRALAETVGSGRMTVRKETRSP